MDERRVKIFLVIFCESRVMDEIWDDNLNYSIDRVCRGRVRRT